MNSEETVIDMVEVDKQHSQIPMHQPVQQYAVSAPATPAGLLQIAVQRGASLDELQKLMDLQERFEANEARKAYVAAMAQFKQNPPEIIKDKKVGYESKDGSGFVGYTHASIGNITSAIVEGLAKHGFSHRWETKQIDGGQIVVTCIITHQLGHSESTTLQSSRDDSGKKNNIQAMASTVTYLQRYTLLAATGLATKDDPFDDDGKKGGDEEKKKQSKPCLREKGFNAALAAIRKGDVPAQMIRDRHDLTVDQETAISDLEKEMKK